MYLRVLKEWPKGPDLSFYCPISSLSYFINFFEILQTTAHTILWEYGQNNDICIIESALYLKSSTRVVFFEIFMRPPMSLYLLNFYKLHITEQVNELYALKYNASCIGIQQNAKSQPIWWGTIFLFVSRYFSTGCDKWSHFLSWICVPTTRRLGN